MLLTVRTVSDVTSTNSWTTMWWDGYGVTLVQRWLRQTIKLYDDDDDDDSMCVTIVVDSSP